MGGFGFRCEAAFRASPAGDAGQIVSATIAARRGPLDDFNVAKERDQRIEGNERGMRGFEAKTQDRAARFTRPRADHAQPCARAAAADGAGCHPSNRMSKEAHRRRRLVDRLHYALGHQSRQYSAADKSVDGDLDHSGTIDCRTLGVSSDVSRTCGEFPFSRELSSFSDLSVFPGRQETSEFVSRALPVMAGGA